jgi:hypothetical protein
MTVPLFLALVPLVVGLAGAATQTTADDRDIAIVDGTHIQHPMIVCGLLLRNDSQRCHVAEQNRLDRLITTRWIDTAVRIHNVTLTPKEKEDVESRVLENRAFNVRAAKRFHLLATIVLRLREGADRATVYADAAAQGLTAADVDGQADLLPTLAIAQRTAARDLVPDIERATREDVVRQAILNHLREIVRKRAADHGQSFEQAAAELWAGIAALTSTRVLDANFHLPDAKRILGSS